MHVKLTTVNSRKMVSDEFFTLFKSISTVKNVTKGTYLFNEGDHAHNIYLIKFGLIQICKNALDGNELSLRICTRGDLIGELTLFSDNPTYFLTAKVLESGKVFSVPRETLESHLMTNQQLSLETMKWVSTHMRRFQSVINDLVLNGRKGALYSTLIRLANSFGIQQTNGILIDFPLTNQQLASFCACTRESVNRMLIALRKTDIISIDKSGRILIKDLDYLKQVNGCHSCPIDFCTIN